MKLVLIPLFAFTFCVSVAFAEEEECKKEIHEMFATMKELAESSEAPQCSKDLELSQYLCGGDEEKAKELIPKFKEFMKGLSDEDKTKVEECFHDLFKASNEKVKLPENCFEKLEEMKEKMDKMMSSE